LRDDKGKARRAEVRGDWRGGEEEETKGREIYLGGRRHEIWGSSKADEPDASGAHSAEAQRPSAGAPFAARNASPVTGGDHADLLGCCELGFCY